MQSKPRRHHHLTPVRTAQSTGNTDCRPGCSSCYCPQDVQKQVAGLCDQGWERGQQVWAGPPKAGSGKVRSGDTLPPRAPRAGTHGSWCRSELLADWLLLMRLKGCFPAGKAHVPDLAEVSRQGNARRQAARPAGGEGDPSRGKPAVPAGTGPALGLISIW